jgi:hypothetical protein
MANFMREKETGKNKGKVWKKNKKPSQLTWVGLKRQALMSDLQPQGSLAFRL